jgi:integrase/recombinase XerD
VARLIEHAGSPVNQLAVRTLYVTGMRVSELVTRTWGDFATVERSGSRRLSIVGKGNKQRYIVLPVALWRQINDLLAPSGRAKNDRVWPVSRQHLHTVVATAAKRAGIVDAHGEHKAVSCH